jgi:hypothetical protein
MNLEAFWVDRFEGERSKGVITVMDWLRRTDLAMHR